MIGKPGSHVTKEICGRVRKKCGIELGFDIHSFQAGDRFVRARRISALGGSALRRRLGSLELSSPKTTSGH